MGFRLSYVVFQGSRQRNLHDAFGGRFRWGKRAEAPWKRSSADKQWGEDGCEREDEGSDKAGRRPGGDTAAKGTALGARGKARHLKEETKDRFKR
ncbi:hypothetical protein Slala05_84530 [Streptomyces lavendulae subsp. lavendulae]|nr:hypothetical protein Slala05_84530 [Streptomyces lavendulae subsp. lavendulae]